MYNDKSLNKELESILFDKNKVINNSGRIFTIAGAIENNISTDINSILLDLQNSNPLSDITMIINSPGGEVDEMFAIIDMMNMIKNDIQTLVIGKAMSAAAVIAICGTKGKRFMSKNSRLMLHSVSGGAVGNIKDISIEINEIKRLNDNIVQMISEKSNLTVEQVKDLIDRDRFIGPEEAIEMGLIDAILTTIK